jgi:hypothetical protein
VTLEGQPLQTGGIQMTSSRVTLGPASAPRSYRGRVLSLTGNRIVATVTGPGNRTLRLEMNVAIDAAQNVSGTIAAK